MDISLLERLTALTKGGKLDEARVRGELQKWLQGFLLARIEPLVQGLVTRTLDARRAVTDLIVGAAVSGLGSIPVAGGAVAAAASAAYNLGMKALADLVSAQGMKLLRKVSDKLLGKVLGKLLRPVLKAANKLLAKTQLGRLLSKGIAALQRIPGGPARVKAVVERLRAGAARWTPALAEKAESWARSKTEAEHGLRELASQLAEAARDEESGEVSEP